MLKIIYLDKSCKIFSKEILFKSLIKRYNENKTTFLIDNIEKSIENYPHNKISIEDLKKVIDTSFKVVTPFDIQSIIDNSFEELQISNRLKFYAENEIISKAAEILTRTLNTPSLVNVEAYYHGIVVEIQNEELLGLANELSNLDIIHEFCLNNLMETSISLNYSESLTNFLSKLKETEYVLNKIRFHGINRIYKEENNKDNYDCNQFISNEIDNNNNNPCRDTATLVDTGTGYGESGAFSSSTGVLTSIALNKARKDAANQAMSRMGNRTKGCPENCFPTFIINFTEPKQLNPTLTEEELMRLSARLGISKDDPLSAGIEVEINKEIGTKVTIRIRWDLYLMCLPKDGLRGTGEENLGGGTILVDGQEVTRKCKSRRSENIKETASAIYSATGLKATRTIISEINILNKKLEVEAREKAISSALLKLSEEALCPRYCPIASSAITALKTNEVIEKVPTNHHQVRYTRITIEVSARWSVLCKKGV